MSNREGLFSAADGLQLFEQHWLPDGDAVADVIFLHGFVEHSGRYADVAEILRGRRYVVHMMDHRGHGRSAGDRIWIRSFSQYVNDLSLFVDRVAKAYSGRPLFLFGHSMGGAIALEYSLRRCADPGDCGPRLAGVVLSAPAIKVGKDLYPILRRLASLVGTLLPRLRLVRAGGRWVSRDPAVVEGFRKDPLVFHDRFPTRTGAEILRAGRRCCRCLESMSLPLLILHGTDDRVTDIQGSMELLARASSADKTLKRYEGLYHDLLHEPEREQVLSDWIAWMDARRVCS
jgi:acylglycerol lipase